MSSGAPKKVDALSTPVDGAEKDAAAEFVPQNKPI